MKKKLIIAILLCIVGLSMLGCGSSKNSNTSDNQNKQVSDNEDKNSKNDSDKVNGK